MARNAEKKAAINAAYWSGILQPTLILINALYFMSILWKLRGGSDDEDAEEIEKDISESSWTWSGVIWPILFPVGEYYSYNWLMNDLYSGNKPVYTLDLFAVLTASHFMAIFSDTLSSYVLYLVPLYLGYTALSWIFWYLKSRSDSATTEDKSQEMDE